jgi:4-amino-4-deoxy-L-arabinose transferase-like glycosyltransferase
VSEESAVPDPEPAVPALARPRPPTHPLARLSERLARWDVALALVVACLILLPGISGHIPIDPWETHYAEVARRILADHDWVHLHWQNEVFRSKPVLTFWLMAAGMKALGVAADGGYSGELTVGDAPIIALRLPFALFAIGGLVITFWMLRRTISRRVAWLGLLAMAACPFYAMVARQAITDMPMVACIMGALSCFAIAVGEGGDRPLAPLWKRVDAYHVFLAVAALCVVGQALHYLVYFILNPRLGPGMKVWQPGLLLGVGFSAGFAGLLALDRWVAPVRTTRQVAMRWAYLLAGVSVLAKGPVGPAVIGMTCLCYLVVVEGEWRLVVYAAGKLARRPWAARWRHGMFATRLSILQGLLLTVLVAAPWHIAMYFKDGRAFTREYFGHHWFGRYGAGVFGDRGTFDYFTSQLAIGMFPLIGLVPFALAWLLGRRTERSDAGRARALIATWAIVSFATVALSQTKFHHYVLPSVPALALVVALWLDEAWRDRRASLALPALGGVLAIVLVARDLVGEQKQLIELFTFRYDRPWPDAAPWQVDVGGEIIGFALVAALATAALAVRRLRRFAIIATLVAALGFAVWSTNGYMEAAAPHWGQRHLHQTYYRLRQIHGVEIEYDGLRELRDDWKHGAYLVETVLPDGFAAGAPMRARLRVPGAGLPKDTIELTGVAAEPSEHAFVLRLDDASRARLAPLLARGERAPRAERPPWVQVDADRLIAWQLNWRGENFWSGGEIYGETDDTRSVFIKTDNTEWNAWIKNPERAGRRFFVITESQRADNLRAVLPTAHGKETVKKIDTTCNKFTLLEFTL